jgi:hypothetical protein
MHSKVSSDWQPSYIKATRPVLEIFKMAGYFPDSPRIQNRRGFEKAGVATALYGLVLGSDVVKMPAH